MNDSKLLDLFQDRVQDYGAAFTRSKPDDLSGTIARVLAARGVGRLMVPGDLPDPWTETIREGGMEVLQDPWTAAGNQSLLSKQRLDAADGALTGCAVAIAETGTIVLAGGPAQGRRVLTLLPDYHLCIVFDGQVVESVPEAVTRLAEDVRGRRAPVTFISGPSATSDIELRRVEGVHGPRTLEVILVEGQ
jgi:L-lactate dehydrogenase complex protein LldG